MSLRQGLQRALERACARLGLVAVERGRLYDWQLQPPPTAGYNAAASLPPDAAGYLRRTNPRLLDLEARYRQCAAEVTTPLLWVPEHLRDEDLLYFRGDNAYVWQLRGRNMNPLAYALTTYYVGSMDTLAMLPRLDDDDCFGNFQFEVAGRRVSRDLLDSLTEIYFLERHIGLSSRSSVTLCDIGAGYGRLAHRVLAALPQVTEYLLTDAVPASTLIAEYYMRHRGITDRAAVVPLDEVGAALAARRVDVAINVHSFSECTLPAIAWWVGQLARAGVRYLFVVPNNLTPGEPSLLNARREDFAGLIRQAGYAVLATEPKYCDPMVQQYGVNPAFHYLFELR